MKTILSVVTQIWPLAFHVSQDSAKFDWIYFGRIALFVIALLANHTVSASPLRPVHTYSIVARDAATGELGVAVQSHWFAVGLMVPWAEAGVGAVATQSFIEPSYGMLGLQLMRAGKSAPEALRALIAIDELSTMRQVALVDALGRVSVHTGSGSIAEAGHRIGHGFVVQANLMLKPGVPDAMAQAYQREKGDLAERMLAALEAAQAIGGDLRGAQSAALIVVSGKATGQPWADKIFDLRIDDDPHPVDKIRHLLRLARAYRHMNNGDDAATKNDAATAMREYAAAEQILPDKATNGESVFWHAVCLVRLGRVVESLPLFRRAFAQDRNWMQLVRRMPKTKQLPDDPLLLKQILSVGP